MITSWEQGRDVIEEMLQLGSLERVAPSRVSADRLIKQARAHILSSRVIAARDAEGSVSLAYDAARKGFTAVLQNQGLRATGLRGHHVTAYEAVRAQLDPPWGRLLRPFEGMRRRRSSAEYPSTDAPSLEPDDARNDADKAEFLIALLASVLDEMPVFVPRSS